MNAELEPRTREPRGRVESHLTLDLGDLLYAPVVNLVNHTISQAAAANLRDLLIEAARKLEPDFRALHEV